jgi:hypothetical protein
MVLAGSRVARAAEFATRITCAASSGSFSTMVAASLREKLGERVRARHFMAMVGSEGSTRVLVAMRFCTMATSCSPSLA